MGYKTEQEEFWSGEFGDQYVERNKQDWMLASNIAMFSDIFQYVDNKNAASVIEFGSNIGLNLMAIKKIIPNIQMGAIEINKKASEQLAKNIEGVKIYNNSILESDINEKYDIVLIKGVLIHIDPHELNEVYRKLYETSKRYILVAEYYNPSPVTIKYRGEENKLFKRDFAGEILDKYKDLRLVTYGFKYYRDSLFPQDDINWFLLEKTGE